MSVFLLCTCTVTDQQSKKKTGAIKHAEHFQLVQVDNYQMLSIYHPKTHQLAARFALVNRGEKPQLAKDIPVISIPVRNMAALSSTFIGMLNELNALTTVSMTTSADYLWNRTIKIRIKEGDCISVSSDDAVSPELLVKKKIELIVFSGFGQPFPNEEKLKRLGVIALPNYDWEETTALGKLEWIKLFGALTGKLEAANTYFDKISKAYNQLKNKAKKHAVNDAPVLVGDFYGEHWIAPAGESYVAGMLKDAGINYRYKNIKGTASLQLSPEQLLKDEQMCVSWINAEGTSLHQLIQQDSKRKQLTVLKHKNVYSYLHNSNYFWEMSVVHPEWLLSDFCQIAQNKSIKHMHFYRKLTE